MKVYEKLGLPYLTEEQYIRIKEFCPKGQGLIETCPINLMETYPSNKTCDDCAYECLNADTPAKRVERWETYNGNFIKSSKDFDAFCEEHSCANGCPYYVNGERTSDCYSRWIKEEIEVEE